MIRTLLSSLMGLLLLCQPLLAQKTDEPKKDAVKKDEPKKDAPKKDEPKGQVVKVKSVDEKTNTLIVTTKDGKALTIKIEKDVKILGPRGGMSDGLKDDRIKAGKEITLFYGKDNKTLTEIRLAVRTSEPVKDKPKDKVPEKDKPAPVKDKPTTTKDKAPEKDKPTTTKDKPKDK